jgi:hypothetical protein
VAETQTYNDGVVKIYETSNTADPGNMPVEGLALKCTLRYDEKTVGINRYYIAMQNDIKIDRLVRCQKIESVTTQDIAVPNDGKQYKIRQIQYPEDVKPPSMDLSLERIDVS